MSITDELREWGSRWEDVVAREVSEIADRIDAEHRAALEKVASMVDHDGWVELPVDADGVTIHVGDELEFCGKRITAIGIGNVTVDEDSMGVFAHHVNGEYEWFNAEFCRHVQPDTWERIIEDAYKLDVAFGEGTEEYARTSVVRELVERCRRLAGE